MWRRWLILLLIVVLPQPALASVGGRCAPAERADAPPGVHLMATTGGEAAMPCCPASEPGDACAGVDCAAASTVLALPAAHAAPGERAHVLCAAPMPGFASVTVSRHDRPPIAPT
ncbi:MAG: hypothetical protein DWQ11_09675 [Proteobacteria bacterium]|nr:MAG: hypothetical protein DWQ11_09675 [Pseudomonadota bacterium]